MTIGIYALRFTGTDKVYIGKSNNIEKRYKEHKYNLKSSLSSKKLQEAYEKFGQPSIEILCECFKEELNKLENEAIEIFNSFNNGFNSLKFSEDSPISDNRGEKHGLSKYSNEQIIEVFNLLVNNSEKTYKEIEKITKVSYRNIKHIVLGESHCWLKDSFPEEYKILISLKGSRLSAKNHGIIYPIVISPEGIEYNVENVSKFAKEYGLHRGNLHHVLLKKRAQHKGWKLKDGS